MAASVGQIGYLTKIYVGDGASAAYVEIVDPTEVTFPEFESDKIEISYLSSPNRTREYTAGFVQPGSMTWKQHYTTAAMTRSQALLNQTKNWKIVCPDLGQAIFAGYLSATKMTVTMDQVMILEQTVVVTGALAWS